MKKYTHPLKNTTFVQFKDGSTIQKKWVYFRSFLRVEAESRFWRHISDKKQFRFYPSANTVTFFPKKPL
jgi:hypothetical protein